VHGLTVIQKGTIEMTTVSRRATTIWDGDLIHGRGTVNSASRALHEMPNTFENRIGGPNGRTSPVELIAAVHPDCFATALPYLLTQEGHPPELLDVSAAVSIDEISGRRPSPPHNQRSRGEPKASTMPHFVMPPSAPALSARCLARWPQLTSP
jgi:organic hydroperoxide reductase OsmC/OhrA